jgi:hypothetical protein
MLVSPQLRIATEDRHPELSPAQRSAVDEIFVSREKIVGLDGVAGAGKTTTLSAIREGAEAQGYTVEGFAPTSRAAHKLAEASIETSTLQHHLARGERPDTGEKRLYLPPDAKVDALEALGPGGTPVQAFQVPLVNKNHYAFALPLRPGETVFQLQYHLRYSGNVTLNPRLTSPAATFIVMMPKSMTFKPSAGTSFEPSDEFPGVQSYLVRNVGPSQSLAFTISGTSLMPRDIQNAEQNRGGPDGPAPGADTSQGAANQAAASDRRPAIGFPKPIGTSPTLAKYRWWILSGIALEFAVAVVFLLRKQADAGTACARQAQTAPSAAAGANS